MRAPGFRAVLITAVLAAALLALCGCKGGDEEPDQGGFRPDTRPTDWGPSGDAYECKRPPTINSCIFPPQSACKDKVLCLGCTCSGALSVFACDGWTQDCRHFCTGCYPQSYTLCTSGAPDTILGLCSECYPKGGCDRLSKKDAGSPDKNK